LYLVLVQPSSKKVIPNRYSKKEPAEKSAGFLLQ
jgi:hypothetical protein